MRIRIRCKILDTFKISDEFDMFFRNFDTLSFGYSKFFENHFAYLNVLGFQIGIEWGYIDLGE